MNTYAHSTLNNKYDRFLEREFNYTEAVKNSDKCIRDFFVFLNNGVTERQMIDRMIYTNGDPMKNVYRTTNISGTIQVRVANIWMMRFLRDNRDALELYLL